MFVVGYGPELGLGCRATTGIAVTTPEAIRLDDQHCGLCSALKSYA